MKPEQLVPSLETCKKLKDFPETFFFYYDGDSCFTENGKNYEWAKSRRLLSVENKANCVFSSDKKEQETVNKYFFPAPTVAELLEVLPGKSLSDIDTLTLQRIEHGGNDKTYIANYEEPQMDAPSNWNYSNESKNPAKALALLYIELKEKGVI